MHEQNLAKQQQAIENARRHEMQQKLKTDEVLKRKFDGSEQLLRDKEKQLQKLTLENQIKRMEHEKNILIASELQEKRRKEKELLLQ